MKKLGTAFLLIITMLLAACGSGNSNSPNGTWKASLAATELGSAMAFTSTFTLNTTSGTLATSNLAITTDSAKCFANQPTAVGSYLPNGTGTQPVTNPFGLAINSPATGGGNNTLLLSGALNGGTISGTWSLNGPQTGCIGGGTFTMKKVQGPGPGRAG